MPYVITVGKMHAITNEPPSSGGVDGLILTSSSAVATLDEAREAAWTAAGWTPNAPDTPGGVHDLRRTHNGFNIHLGGTIGPLPNGTTIHVEHVEWHELWHRANSGKGPRDWMHVPFDDILGTYNAQHEHA